MYTPSVYSNGTASAGEWYGGEYISDMVCGRVYVCHGVEYIYIYKIYYTYIRIYDVYCIVRLCVCNIRRHGRPARGGERRRCVG